MLRAAASIAALVFFAACSLGPQYQEPEIEVPEQWQESAQGTGIWPSAEWWSGFGSAELDRLMAAAVSNNHDLRAAASRVLQSEAQAKIAGAALYPALSAGGSATRTKQADRGDDRGPGRFPSAQTTYQASLSAAYEIDVWGKNRSAADAALTRLRSSQFDGQTVAITLVSDVGSTYFQVLSLRDRIRLAEETLRNAESILDLLEHQQGAGAISDLQVSQQRSAVATQRAAIPALRQSERQAIDALAILLGRNPERQTISAQTLEEVRVPEVVAGLPSSLLERRPDIRKAEADLVASHFDIVNARAQRFPSIELTAAGGTESAALSNLFGPGSFLYNLAAAATAPLFEGGRLEGQEELAQARYQELLEAYQQAILSAFRDVEDALAAVKNARARYGFQREAFEQAREAYRIGALQFRAGTVDFLSVLEAQRSVFEAQDALVQADLARFDALIGLYKALGGGWDGTIPPPPATATSAGPSR